MTLYAGGLNDFYQLGTNNGSLSTDCKKVVDSMTAVQFDLQGIQCISGGVRHSVIIKSGSVFASGDDREFIIGGDSRVIYQTFTNIKIFSEAVCWAACGWDFTLYLTINGKAILCSKKAKGSRINIQLARRAVSVFAGRAYGCIIDDEGQINVLDRDDPLKEPTRFWLGSPAIDVACCDDFICVLAVDGRVFMINNQDSITEVRSLSGIRIEKLSGNTDVCAALSSDGRVFICGNDKCKINQRSIKFYPFYEVTIPSETIKDVSCTNHILLLTNSKKMFGLGFNKYCQLFQKTETDDVRSWAPINTSKLFFGMISIPIDQVIACGYHSFILSSTGKVENPAKVHFFGQTKLDSINSTQLNGSNKFDKLIETINAQSKEITSLSNICRTQTTSIDRLIHVCDTLQRQSDVDRLTFNIEIHKIGSELEQAKKENQSLKQELVQAMKKEREEAKLETMGMREEMSLIKQAMIGISKDTISLAQETQKMKEQVNVMREDTNLIKQYIVLIRKEKNGMSQEPPPNKQDIEQVRQEILRSKADMRAMKQELSEQTKQSQFEIYTMRKEIDQKMQEMVTETQNMVQEMKEVNEGVYDILTDTNQIKPEILEITQKTINISRGMAKSLQDTELMKQILNNNYEDTRQIKPVIFSIDQKTNSTSQGMTKVMSTIESIKLNQDNIYNDTQAVKKMVQVIKKETQGMKQKNQNLRQDILGIKQDVFGNGQKLIGIKNDMTIKFKEMIDKIELEEIW